MANVIKRTQTALVTGASSGIGLEFARILAKEKHDLVLIARNRPRLEEIARELQQHHLVKVKIIDKDLTLMNSIDEIFRELQAEKIRIDVLINNAGFGDYGPFLETAWDKEHRMISLNITALTYLTKLFAKPMVERGHGRICNVASTAAFQPGPLMAVYFATKAYVLSFSEAIANELEGTGVTVTTLCPGATESGFQDTANIAESRLIKGRKLPSSADVARFGYDAMIKGKTVAIHGWVNFLMTESLRLSPRKLVTKVVRTMQEAQLS